MSSRQIRLSISPQPDPDADVSLAKMRLRERLMHWLFGPMQDLMLIVPGHEVDAVTITCTKQAEPALSDEELEELAASITRRPAGNAVTVESLHNRMRDELLEDNMFEDLDHACTLIGAWSHRYNEEHPHSALGWLSPNQYVRQWAHHHQ